MACPQAILSDADHRRGAALATGFIATAHLDVVLTKLSQLAAGTPAATPTPTAPSASASSVAPAASGEGSPPAQPAASSAAAAAAAAAPSRLERLGTLFGRATSAATAHAAGTRGTETIHDRAAALALALAHTAAKAPREFLRSARFEFLVCLPLWSLLGGAQGNPWRLAAAQAAEAIAQAAVEHRASLVLAAAKQEGWDSWALPRRDELLAALLPIIGKPEGGAKAEQASSAAQAAALLAAAALARAAPQPPPEHAREALLSAALPLLASHKAPAAAGSAAAAPAAGQTGASSSLSASERAAASAPSPIAALDVLLAALLDTTAAAAADAEGDSSSSGSGGAGIQEALSPLLTALAARFASPSATPLDRERSLKAASALLAHAAELAERAEPGAAQRRSRGGASSAAAGDLLLARALAAAVPALGDSSASIRRVAAEAVLSLHALFLRGPGEPAEEPLLSPSRTAPRASESCVPPASAACSSAFEARLSETSAGDAQQQQQSEGDSGRRNPPREEPGAGDSLVAALRAVSAVGNSAAARAVRVSVLKSETHALRALD